ncbi:hypothetical protein ES677_01875 [Bizionia gelidisalsuginis]|uniref:Lipoprotein n=1 Tax=Bizionia gelidisalsuginis TaxID=291188 RepID=A0ABY3MEZ5_9FLAO|nr:hypothetical protein [Bizionia gelidisalsuginis]TYC18152.1 hypothetical protein ES677_01875 [Bizionia gelidisalsuginis]
MKFKNLCILVVTTVLFSSCASNSFYQLYNVKPVTKSITDAEKFFFEDDNCKITYHLWANGGNIGFDFYNKTDTTIYVKLNESHFILNDFAYDYFKNRTFTTSEGNSTTSSKTKTATVAVTGLNLFNLLQTNQAQSSSTSNLSSLVGYSVSIKENTRIAIPSKTSKRISEYDISDALVRHCDLLKYPNKREISTKSYTADKSPIVFSNRIAYQIKENSKVVDNEFFVSAVTNYPESEFLESRYDAYCDQKSVLKSKHFKFYDSNKFYIKYSKNADNWKH